MEKSIAGLTPKEEGDKNYVSKSILSANIIHKYAKSDLNHDEKELARLLLIQNTARRSYERVGLEFDNPVSETSVDEYSKRVRLNGDMDSVERFVSTLESYVANPSGVSKECKKELLEKGCVVESEAGSNPIKQYQKPRGMDNIKGGRWPGKDDPFGDSGQNT